MLKNSKLISGFTLLEIVIVIALISFISMIAVPFGVREIQRANASSTAIDLSSIIFLTQQNAYAGLNNTSHGVAFYNNRYILFEGDSLASASNQETVFFQNDAQIDLITLSGGGNELIFSKGSIRPQKTGTIRITEESSSYQISINTEGFVDTYSL